MKSINNTSRKIYLYSFNYITHLSLQEYSVQITFRQQWNDNRLAFNDLKGRIKYLTMTDSKKVWMPDTFFRNEKLGNFHNILTPNLYIRVHPDGDVLYSIRISLTCFCSMYLALFPLDEQTCNLDIASCKFDESRLYTSPNSPQTLCF